MKVIFVWGAGGVGKSHLSIRSIVDQKGDNLLVTLDPSQRVLDLLHQPRDQKETKVEFDEFHFTVKTTNAQRLFERLEQKRPAHSTVRVFFDRMTKGLQEFRDYLSLVQLSDEVTGSKFDTIVIDTPPFQEAIGLHRSIFNLKNFFEKSLVQLAIKTTEMSWLQGTVKKVFEATRIFVGKKAADQLFDFIEWLSFHTDRFKAAAIGLENLIFSEATLHRFVVLPDTPASFFESVKSFFSEHNLQMEFVINRSVESYLLPEGSDEFLQEIRKAQSLEKLTAERILKLFPSAKIKRLPLILMGADTPEELRRFLQLPIA